LNKAESSAEESCDLAPGEALLLYTDGLYEMQNAAGERMGHEALSRMLPPVGEQGAKTANGASGAGGASAAGVWLDSIIEKATEYADSVSFPDDIAAFAALYKG
jgi:hypothetical protein